MNKLSIVIISSSVIHAVEAEPSIKNYTLQ